MIPQTESMHHPVVTKIETLLKERARWFEKFEHEPVRTSEEAAGVRDTYTLSEGAKALIVRLKKGSETRFAMIVVPGDTRFDAKKARTILDAKDIRFASVEEVAKITDGVLPGGVPPFGNLFGLAVYADRRMFEHERMIFNAGDRRVSIGMHTNDYRDIVAPHIVSIAEAGV